MQTGAGKQDNFLWLNCRVVLEEKVLWKRREQAGAAKKMPCWGEQNLPSTRLSLLPTPCLHSSHPMSAKTGKRGCQVSKESRGAGWSTVSAGHIRVTPPTVFLRHLLWEVRRFCSQIRRLRATIFGGFSINVSINASCFEYNQRYENKNATNVEVKHSYWQSEHGKIERGCVDHWIIIDSAICLKPPVVHATLEPKCDVNNPKEPVPRKRKTYLCERDIRTKEPAGRYGCHTFALILWWVHIHQHLITILASQQHAGPGEKSKSNIAASSFWLYRRQ